MMRKKQPLKQGQDFFNSAKKNAVSYKLKDSIKSIYQMTWKGFYHELHRQSMAVFLRKYHYQTKKKLQIDFARANHGLEFFSLHTFNQVSKKTLKILMGENFNKRVQLDKCFRQKGYKLSTIHHFLYGHSLYFAAISLGFFSKQCFLNFFIRSNYVKDFTVDALKSSLDSLKKSPDELSQKLGHLYHEVVKINKPDNKSFKRYNCTLEELKFLLEKEHKYYVIASLGGDSNFRINKALKKLSPNLSLCYLQEQPLEILRKEIPESCWVGKLYQLFEKAKRSKSKQKPFSLLSALYAQRKAVPFYQVISLACLEQGEEVRGGNSHPNKASSSAAPIWRPF